MALRLQYFWLLLPSLTAAAKIDRRRILSEHNIVRTNLIDNETTPLQVGNGDFAFGVDTTGMQTYLPFNTMSSWAWHNDTLPDTYVTIRLIHMLPHPQVDTLTEFLSEIDEYTGVPMVTHGRNVSYDIPDPELPDVSQWLIGNPNRVNLGRIGLRYKGDTLTGSEIADTHQELDLWNGVIRSTFTVAGEQVEVITRGDFDSDAVSFDIESELVKSGELSVEFDFPYPPIHTTKYKYEVFVGSYDFPANHTTKLIRGCDGHTAHIHHDLADGYHVNIRWPEQKPLTMTRLEPPDSTEKTAHRYVLSPTDGSTMSFTSHFGRERLTPDLPKEIQKRNARRWHEYWKEGGFVDLTESTNPNATELQRRIVTSQYHVRVNSAATGVSPQESGLMNNGWYGTEHQMPLQSTLTITEINADASQASSIWRWWFGITHIGCLGVASNISTTSSRQYMRSSWTHLWLGPLLWVGRARDGQR